MKEISLIVSISSLLFIIEGKTWVDFLSLYQDQYNTSPHRSLGKERSPFEVFFGRKCNFDFSLLREECMQSEEIGKRLISLKKNCKI